MWSVWTAVIGEQPFGTTAIVLVVTGLVLVTRPGRALVTWIGDGVITGVCLAAGCGFFALGLLMLFPYAQLLAQGLRIPVGALVIPLLVLGCGVLLLVRGVRRLWRLRGLPRWRG